MAGRAGTGPLARWNPFAPLSALARERMLAWMRRRQGLDHLPVTLGRRRLYILPTRAGLAFAALLFMMLLAGLNYANSLALLVTFVLAGFALVVMQQCHRNLLGTEVSAAIAPAVFAGSLGKVQLTLASSAPLARRQLEAALPNGALVVTDGPAQARAGAPRAGASFHRSPVRAVSHLDLAARAHRDAGLPGPARLAADADRARQPAGRPPDPRRGG